MTVLMYNLVFFFKDLEFVVFWLFFSVVCKVLKVLFFSSNERTWETSRPFHLYNPFPAEVVWWRRGGSMFCCDFPQWISIYRIIVKKSFLTKPIFPKLPPPTHLNTLLSPFLSLRPHPVLAVFRDPWEFLGASLCVACCHTCSPPLVFLLDHGLHESTDPVHLPPRCVRAWWMSHKSEELICTYRETSKVGFWE